ncbi:MAG: oligosaccharide flippase family protein [Bryobacteraceae bacterium]
MLLMYFGETKTRILRFLPADSLRGRLALGTFWSLIGAVLSQSSIILASIISARILGTVGFGELAIINSTVGMLGVFAGFGLGMTATKYVAEFRTKDPSRAGRIIALSSVVAFATGGIIALALFAFAPFLATRTLAAPHLVLEFRIGAFLLLFNAINGAQTGALSGFEAFRALAYANLIRGLASLPVMVGGVLLWGLPGAVFGLVLAAAIACLVNQLVLRKECRRAAVPIRYRSIASEGRVIWDFSLPAFLSSAMTAPATWAVSTMLVNQPNGYAEMGIFNAANQWRAALLFLPTLIGQVVIPILASLQDVQGRSSARKVLLGSMLTNGLCTLPLLVILVPFASWIMSFYGRAFSTHGAVLQVSLLSGVLLAIQTPVGNLITAFGRMWSGFFMNAGWAVCLVGTAHGLLVLGWGAQALACAFLVAYLAHTIWTLWFAVVVLRPDQSSPEPVPVGAHL